MKCLKWFAGASGALALMIQSSPAHPPRPGPPPRPAPPHASIDFLVAGRPLPIESSRHGVPFVAVPRWGVEYEIRIRNNEPRDRVLFVIGVDGLSVMDGSHVSRNSGGYVLDPGETFRIRGWRRGNHRVAAFTFTSAGDSYAGRTGHPGQIGQISIWTIREEGHRPIPIVPYRKGSSGPMNDQAGKGAPDPARHSRSNTGTGYGVELEDHVRPTHFVRSSSVRHLTYRYGLRPVVVRPHREPAESFAPAPPGWQEARLQEVER